MIDRVWMRRVAAGPLRAVAIAALAAVPLSGQAFALEEKKGEEAAITDCDRRLCAILLGKSAQGPDLRCALTKTWSRSKIKEADSQQLSWGYGDARCTVNINLNRARLVAVMSGERGTYRVPPHTANCVVEQGGQLEKVTAVLAPKIVFKNGKADKIWVNLKSIDGPGSITLTLQTAAQLADTFGLFHRQMIKSINRYIERHCPTTQTVSAGPPPFVPAKDAKPSEAAPAPAAADNAAKEAAPPAAEPEAKDTKSEQPNTGQ